MGDHANDQAKVLLRPQGQSGWPLAHSGSRTIAGIEEVVKGEAGLAIVNPSSALTVAIRGHAPFTEPQPVAPIAVIPSLDLCLFGAEQRTGVERFVLEEGDYLSEGIHIIVVALGLFAVPESPFRCAAPASRRPGNWAKA